jgi:hypothetical protein
MTRRVDVGLRGVGKRWIAAAGIAAAALAVGSTASAHGEDVERPSPPTGREAETAPPAPLGQPEAGKTEAHHEEEERFAVGLDLVLGWGKVPFAVQNLPTSGNQAITYTRSDQTQSNVQSFILVASAEVAPHLGVGLRAPFTFAGFTPDGSAARSTTDFGNLELEGEYSAPVNRSLRLVGALGVALPTAQGDEIPDGLSQAPASSVNQTAYDRWSLGRAAAFARGFEDNALFEPKRLGLVPKIGVLYHARGFSVEPYVKVENLIGTSTTLAQSYVGELVAAVRVGYWVHKQFEVALRGWANVGYAGADEDKKTSVALEPQLITRFGALRPYAGVIIPLTGLPQDNGFFGVRVGLAGGF